MLRALSSFAHPRVRNVFLRTCTFAVPTFVGFLRDIESAYEVKEYVRVYLGDTKQSTEFGKQFLEKRSKWRSAQRPQAQADDLCKPAPAVNPNAPAEFQEVKVYCSCVKLPAPVSRCPCLMASEETYAPNSCKIR